MPVSVKSKLDNERNFHQNVKQGIGNKPVGKANRFRCATHKGSMNLWNTAIRCKPSSATLQIGALYTERKLLVNNCYYLAVRLTARL